MTFQVPFHDKYSECCTSDVGPTIKKPCYSENEAKPISLPTLMLTAQAVFHLEHRQTQTQSHAERHKLADILWVLQ